MITERANKIGIISLFVAGVLLSNGSHAEQVQTASERIQAAVPLNSHVHRTSVIFVLH